MSEGCSTTLINHAECWTQCQPLTTS